MSDSAQESQKRHFSKIRPHVLDAAFAREFLGYRKTVFAAPFILYLWAAVLCDAIGLSARSGHSVSEL
jgi:hypothetical protein